MRGRLFGPWLGKRFGAALAATVLASAAAVSSTGCGDARREHGSDARPRPDARPIADAAPDGPPAPAHCEVRRGSNVKLGLVTRLPGSALLVVSPPSDPRLFVVAQSGQLRIVTKGGGGQLLAEPFLDLASSAGGPVFFDGERGLLGLAFHPQYATNRTFYVFYTTETANVLARYRARADEPDRADPDSGEILLSIPDTMPTHNGGMIAFGPDGLLYVGTGDGGGAYDPDGNAQDPRALLGKVLRLDVDRDGGPDGKPYGIPPGNPFADGALGEPEIFMLGLRNPWRWSFDESGDLYLADVGQDLEEELTILPAGTGAGQNLGWPRYEGRSCAQGDSARGDARWGESEEELTVLPAGTGDGRNLGYEGWSCAQGYPARGDARWGESLELAPARGDGKVPSLSTCSPGGLTFPQLVKTHAGHRFCSIIGGGVYRGSCAPELVGRYFFTDLCYGGVRSLRYQAGAISEEKVELGPGQPTVPVSLHAAAYGELYLTTAEGHVYHLEAAP